MRLREIDLDAPDAPRELQVRFRRLIRGAAALYSRCLPPMEVAEGWKVLVECVPVVSRTDVRDLLGVLTVQRAFDVEAFIQAALGERATLATAELHEGALEVARQLGWPTAPFDEALRAVVERGYTNTWEQGRPRWSKDRKHQARLLCRHDEDAFSAWIVVSDRGGDELLRERVLYEIPDEFVFVPKLGVLVWTSNTEITLLNRRGEPVTSAHLPA